MNKQPRKGDWPFLCAWLSLLLIAGYLQATDISFHGNLVDNACVFEQDGGAQEVVFPTVAAKFFSTHTRTETKVFSVGLKNCPESVRDKLVNLTFSFPQQEELGGVRMLRPDGNTGVLIALVDSAGKAIEPEKPVSVGNISATGAGTVNRFSLGAYVTVPPDRVVNPGQYSATTTFTVGFE